MTGIFGSILGEGFSIWSYLLVLLFSLLCGACCAVALSVLAEGSRSFKASLIALPAIVATVIIIVNGQIGTGVAVMGAFSLIRFRSVAGRAKDIAFIFLAMTAGIGAGAGYVAISLLFTALICAVLVGASFIPFASDGEYVLNITVPEGLRFMGEFDDVFKKYTKCAKLKKAKTTNMGTLYRLTYKIDLRAGADLQSFIDDLRCRNGNLEIAVMDNGDNSEDL